MDYEHSVLDFYPVFLASFEAGLQDGSIRRRADPLLIYNSVTHAIICLAQKHLRGRILLSDSDTSGEEELSLVIDMLSGDYDPASFFSASRSVSTTLPRVRRTMSGNQNCT